MTGRLCRWMLCVVVVGFASSTVIDVSLAAVGDPLPGVDVVVWGEPPYPTFIEFGPDDPDFPPLPIDYFGPGSDPFEGHVALKPADNKDHSCTLSSCPPPHSEIIPREGGTPGEIPVELLPLRLRSVEPVAVDMGTYDSFFDVFTELSAVGLPEEPISGTLLTPPGSTDPVQPLVDSFFDITYRVEFVEVGTGEPAAGGPLTGSLLLSMQNPPLSVPVFQDPATGQVIPGFDGATIVPITYGSPGGGLSVTLEAMPEPGSLMLGLGLAGMCLAAHRAARRRHR